jgi:hypothetical protein
MAITPEGRVKAQIKAYLNSIGAYWFMPVQTGYGKPTLDFLVCWKGRFFGIEAKRSGKALTKFQKLIVAEIERAGGVAFMADNVEIVKWHLQN